MIQVFGSNKCFDTKKITMYFKERRINFSYINLKEKEISEKEFDSIYHSVKDINALINQCSKLYKEFYIEHMERTYEQYKRLLIENPDLLKTPIIRCKNSSIVGFNKEKVEEFLKRIN